jgi:hypothetical protein
MKTIIRTATLILVLTACMTSCQDNSIERITYEANVPIYMSFNDFRGSFDKSEPIEITYPGKIYFKDGYLFVNEYGKGIHVIDNSDPSDPQKIAFYEILGNVDMAIRGDILYADSYIDLVAIDISDINNPVEVGRLLNVFPEIVPQGDLWRPYSRVDKSKGVIIGWELKTITEVVDSHSGYYRGGDLVFMAAAEFRGSYSGGSMSAGAGVGGSMARFMLNEEYLYLISIPYRLKTVNVGAASAMSVVDSVDVPRNMETLYRLDDKMFIGTTTGMLIFDLVNPVKPRQISSYDHLTACDPVVVDGQYAYVTLRTGNRCPNAQNLLEVIDISSLTNPYLVKSYPMFNPHGLGVDGDLLFVCDGAAGLKVYDKTNPLEIISNQVAYYPDFDTFDVIPLNGVLMLIGEDGIYQYDYSDPANITQISHITIKEN